MQAPLAVSERSRALQGTLCVLLAEDEEDGAAEAEGRPDEVEAEFLAHEDQGERHEDRQRDDLLHDLQLRQREGRVADAVMTSTAFLWLSSLTCV